MLIVAHNGGGSGFAMGTAWLALFLGGVAAVATVVAVIAWFVRDGALSRNSGFVLAAAWALAALSFLVSRAA